MAKQKSVKDHVWALTQEALAARDMPQAIPLGLTREQKVLCQIHDRIGWEHSSRFEVMAMRRIFVDHIYRALPEKYKQHPEGPKTAQAIIVELNKVKIPILHDAKISTIRRDMRDYVLKQTVPQKQ